MSFDGRIYPGASLIYPAAYHPKAPAIAEVPSAAFLVAYLFSRTHGRKIGDQTYRHYQVDLTTYGDGSSGNAEDPSNFLTSAAFRDIAKFEKRIPAYATHIEAEIFFKVVAVEPGVGKHRVVVSIGGTVDTGVTVDTEFEQPGTQAPRPEHLQEHIALTGQSGETLHSPNYPGNLSVSVQVPLTNVGPSLPAEVTVEVQGYAIGESGSAIGYRPDFITAAWKAL